MTTTHHGPEMAQDAPRYFKTDIPPETVFVAIGKLREDARDEIDRLIQFLDKTDDYVSRELEECVDDIACDDTELEPSLCGINATAAHAHLTCMEDGEEEQEDEPSLGSVCAYCSTSQDGGKWSAGGSSDLEDEHDGSEPSLCGTTSDAGIMDDRDLEADLGSFDRMVDQRKSMREAEFNYHTFGGWPVAHGEFDDVRPVS